MMKVMLTFAALLAASPAVAFDLGLGRPYDHSMQATGTSELGLPPFRATRGPHADACARSANWDDACAVHRGDRF